MANIKSQVNGILRIHEEISQQIIEELTNLDGGSGSRSIGECDAIIMGFVLHFAENMLHIKATTEAGKTYASSSDSHGLYGQRKKSLMDSGYYSAVRATKQIGTSGISVYELAQAQAVALIEQLEVEDTEHNRSVIAGYFIVLYDEMHTVSQQTGGTGGKIGKKLIVVVIAVIVAVLLFTVGPFSKKSENERSNVTEPTETSEEADAEPVYESFCDLNFQVNVDSNAFMKVESYKDLTLTDYSDEESKELSDEEKKSLWGNVTYGEDYCSKEAVYQNFITQDILDFVMIEINNSDIDGVDDYIEWAEENISSKETSIDSLKAAIITKGDENYKVDEVVFFYNDRCYLIGVYPMYSSAEELTASVIKSIKIKDSSDSNENEEAISWKDAGDYIGQTITVKGKVAAVDYSPSSNGSPVFIDIGEAYPAAGRVSAIIWEENQSQFGVSPDNFDSLYSVGDTIYVKGTIEKYKDAYSIDVYSPEQIK